MGKSQAPTTGENVEQITEHISREWILNHQIMILHNSSSSRASIDRAIDAYLEVIQKWDKNKPFLSILESKNLTMTPYGQKRLKEVAQSMPEVKGRTAVIINRGPVGHLIRLFVKTLRQSGNRERQVFFTHDEAIAWLKELLPPLP